MNRVLAALSGLLMLLGLGLFAPAQAAENYTPFKAAGWWDKVNPAATQTDGQYLWAQFPVACNAGPNSTPSVHVLWLHPDSVASNFTSRDVNVRNAIRAAGSMYSASARRFVASQADQQATSLSPKWLTTSTCAITVTPVAVPAALFNSGTWDNWPVREWLHDQGYNRADRKYVGLLQQVPGGSFTGFWRDHSDNYARGTVDPTIENPANYGSYSFIATSNLAIGADGTAGSLSKSLAHGMSIAHELTHSLGALATGAPHENASNPGHPTDCNDILCYGGEGAGETVVCGTAPSYVNRPASRLDCNRDDYFTATGDEGTLEQAWSVTRWNTAHSSFLWGNPNPTPEQIAAHPTPRS